MANVKADGDKKFFVWDGIKLCKSCMVDSDESTDFVSNEVVSDGWKLYEIPHGSNANLITELGLTIKLENEACRVSKRLYKPIGNGFWVRYLPLAECAAKVKTTEGCSIFFRHDE